MAFAFIFASPKRGLPREDTEEIRNTFSHVFLHVSVVKSFRFPIQSPAA
jgi:hypothetical protein